MSSFIPVYIHQHIAIDFGTCHSVGVGEYLYRGQVDIHLAA
ncbi:hypothetical protein FHS09_003277 [Microbulbifer rhizosphaerae]|uniref:Uncharacterized protein n=1 Tax=Microbulbifer rhizosphaerae TaxID=1562603 RepID=A0A7W4ZA20_9GAMM|nr:hypothetical protein [Microbulbifer rhizosphaerae]